MQLLTAIDNFKGATYTGPMNMNTIARMRAVGTTLFIAMWLPFLCIFAGMAAEFGSWAQPIVQTAPFLLAPRPSGFSLLSAAAMALTFALMFTAMALLFGAPLLAGLANRRIRRSGLQAEAHILSVEQTGTYINDNPVVRFRLEVQPLTGGPFEAETEKLVPMVQIPQLQPGATIRVHYDPASYEVAISE